MKDLSERINEIELKVGGILQTLQYVNEIKQKQADIESLENMIRVKSREVNNFEL